jgi:flagella basal body P-ring formation protein FlgA
MKRIAVIVILLTTLLSNVDRGECASLFQVVADKLSARFGLDSVTSRIEILKSQLPDESLDADQVTIRPLFDKEPVGLVSVVAEITDSSNSVRRGQISLRVHKYAEVAVTVSALKLREALSPDQFTIQLMEVTSLREQPVTSLSAVLGSRAKRNLAVGRILTTEAIETAPDIEVGREVAITFTGHSFTVTTRGQAMQTGRIGETIRVRNAVSGKTILARVTGANEVTTEL